MGESALPDMDELEHFHSQCSAASLAVPQGAKQFAAKVVENVKARLRR